jgi:hypothetical protein
MPWVRIDDHFPDHPKIVSAGPLGAWLYVAGLCYCNRLLTNGFIPVSQVARLVPADHPEVFSTKLCDLRLWSATTRRGVDGFLVHDYLKYQASKAKILKKRAETTERVRRLRTGAVTPLQAAYTGVGNGVGNTTPNPNPKVQKQPSVVEPPKKPADPRVREFLVWFQSEYKARRSGADYLVSWAKHGAMVKEMLGATDLDRLKKYAQILLSDKTDDEFIVASDRGIEVFRAKFSWLSDRLSAWETRHPVPA